MKAWMALLLMTAACGGGSEKPDAKTDGPPDTKACFGSFVTICFPSAANVPTTSVMLTDLTIDTGSSPMCDQNNDHKNDYCVIAGADITLPANKTIRAFGTKPLVLLSTSTMVLQGQSTIDVSSNRMATPQATGAGANPTMCVNGVAPTASGGGFGGSFGGKGGDGERLAGAPATSGAAATALAPPTQLRGGCPGGNGDVSGGPGGSGGGAVALIAVTSIQLDGKINASGAGGKGGPATKSGGGGGGSGGMIVLDAPSIMATGPLFANGGGGGQGGTGVGTGVGPGDDGGESLAPSTPAPAGNNTNRTGGSGGTGSAGIRLAGNNGGSTVAVGNGGGGGGGGGAGFIRAPGITTNIAPPSFVP